MHVLVTGGAGFLGSALVDRLLAGGHQVDVVDNLSAGSLSNLAEARRVAGRELTFHQLDVRSTAVAELIGRRRPEVIWHLAGRTSVPASVEQAALDGEVNVVGTLNVLDAARASGCRKIVAVGAAAVYGVPERLPIREGDRRQPRSPHGVAKHAVDAYLATFRELHRLEFTSLVLANAYGPREHAQAGVVARWARALVAGVPCTLEGSGTQTRDFVFVDDAVDALARAADHGDGLVLNVGTGRETSLNELHGLMLEAAADAGIDASGSSAVLGAPERRDEVGRCCLDATRAGIYLDWRAWTPLREGLAAVMRAVRAEPVVKRAGVERAGVERAGVERAGPEPAGPGESAEEILGVGPDDLGPD